MFCILFLLEDFWEHLVSDRGSFEALNNCVGKSFKEGVLNGNVLGRKSEQDPVFFSKLLRLMKRLL